MQYHGGKAKVAPDIARIVVSQSGDRTRYLEPFVGAASVLSLVAPHFRTVDAGDAHEDLILLWRAVRMGWKPPASVNRAQYESLRDADPSALRGFVGFACSYAGKWFQGYARDLEPGSRRNYAHAAARNVQRRSRSMRRVNLRCCDFREWTETVDETTVAYCDPPYGGTTGFSTGDFDHHQFWTVMDHWVSRGAVVLVSEYEAPDGWDQVWSRHLRSSPLQDKGGNVERLFMRRGTLDRHGTGPGETSTTAERGSLPRAS